MYKPHDSKLHDSAFDECIEQYETPAEIAGAVVAARSGGPTGAAAGVLAHHAVNAFGEAICDGTLTSDAFGPPVSYFGAKTEFLPGSAPPNFDSHSVEFFGVDFHPSYTDAKLGYDIGHGFAPAFTNEVDSSTPQAHLDRNEWQVELVPEHMPQKMPFDDVYTGVTWSPDSRISETIWHGANNDCFRGVLPDERVEALQANPAYRNAFEQLNGHNGYNVDHVTPGAQACYDGTTGTLIDKGPHAGTWDFASPSVPGQELAHFNLDVVPDWHDDHYTAIHAASLDSGSHHDGGAGYGADYSDSGTDSGGGHSDTGSHNADSTSSGDGHGI